MTTEVDIDAAMQELAGGGMPPLAPGEKPSAPAPRRDEELTVAGPAKPSPVKAADAVHATASGGKGYLVDVYGEYFAISATGKGKEKKPYLVKNVGVPRLEGCPSFIKSRIKQIVLKAYPDWVSDRTIHIANVRPVGGARPTNNVAFMDRGQLEAVVEEKSIPVDLASFAKDDKGTTQLRESVIDFIQNPDPVKLDDKGKNTVKPGDVGTFVYREAQRKQTRDDDAAFAQLNPGVEA